MIETPRLTLKEPYDGELDLVAPLQADPVVMRFIGKGNPKSVEEVKGNLQKNLNHWKAFGHGFWNVFEKESGDFVGRAGLVRLAYNHDDPDIEIGYHLHQKFWGRGYATELCKALLKWGFDHLSIDYFIGVAYKENIRSQKVMQKSGMLFDKEGIYPGTDFMSLFYKKIR